jgi:hypothetical protein
MGTGISDYNLVEKIQDRIEAFNKLVRLVFHDHTQSDFHPLLSRSLTITLYDDSAHLRIREL